MSTNADLSKDTLLNNIDRIHTTKLGIERIKRNLVIDPKDVVEYCKEKIAISDDITKIGKNWYVVVDNSTFVINSHSFTIITAYKK